MEWHHELSLLKLKQEHKEGGELEQKQKEQKQVWRQELQRVKQSLELSVFRLWE